MKRLVGATTIIFVAAFVAKVATSEEQRLPARLAETGLFTLGRPFSPQYPLWSDGATKARWVYLPPGGVIDGTDDAAWTFPVGTRLWKEFTFNGRKVETRLLWKTAANEWTVASYAWNDDGTDAVLAPPEGLVTSQEVAPGRRHVIPAQTDCLACHGAKHTGPLGFNALQLSPDRDPHAIHGEPLGARMVTLTTLLDEGLLLPSRRDLATNPPRIPASDPTTRAVLGYLAANCGPCHNRSGEIATFGPSLLHSEVTSSGESVARALVNHPTQWQVPGVGEGASVLIDPRRPELSAMLVRMRSRQPSTQMPPLGTLVRDQEAVETITKWIVAALGQSH